MSASTLFFSLLGGVLPALLWLWFWLREDRLHPEPRALIMLSFMWGMLVVLFALPVEQWIWGLPPSMAQTIIDWSHTKEIITFVDSYFGLSSKMALVIIGWSITEEVFKFIASYLGALRNRENNEPIDSLIYLITAALGFAALENTLFLAEAIKTGGFIQGLDLGVLRFVGASLLHVISSGVFGFFLALGFYKRGSVKKIDAVIGLGAAIVLHVLFNLFIIKGEGNSTYTFTVFTFLWLAVTLLLVGFEKVKQLKA